VWRGPQKLKPKIERIVDLSNISSIQTGSSYKLGVCRVIRRKVIEDHEYTVDFDSNIIAAFTWKNVPRGDFTFHGYQSFE